jgi:two-component sensor histidine kinase
MRAYAVALGIFVVSLAARFALDWVLPQRVPFITFFPAVLLATYLCGLAPGIAVLVLSGIAGTVWLDPTGSARFVERAAGFLVFMLVGGTQVFLIQLIGRATARLDRQEQQLLLINRELKHRLKNLFSITNSIFQQSLKSGHAPDDLARIVSGRVRAIAAAQDLLSVAADEGSSLQALVEAVVKPLAPHPSRLHLQGAAAVLVAEHTTPVALLLHELALNAVKHGAWRGNAGTVSIVWKTLAGTAGERRIALEWREADGGRVAPALRSGFGTMLIQHGVPEARVDYDLRPEGLVCRIDLPSDKTAASVGENEAPGRVTAITLA